MVHNTIVLQKQKKMDEKKSNLLDALNIKGQIVLKRLSVSKGEEKKKH